MIDTWCVPDVKLCRLVHDIEANIEYLNDMLYRNMVFRDLIHLAPDDVARLSADELASVNKIINELSDISYEDGSLDNLADTMEYYEQDAVNYIDKATQGRGVKY